MPATAFAMALSTFVSQNKGADQPERIRDGVRIANTISAVMAVFISVVLWLAAPTLVRFLSGSSESVVIDNGATLSHDQRTILFCFGYSSEPSKLIAGLGTQDHSIDLQRHRILWEDRVCLAVHSYFGVF